jgi:hypothetical protein
MRQIALRAFILTLLAGIVPLVNPAASAQSAVRLEQLQVDLWPEFDQPDVLVIYRGRLPADTPLPVILTLHLPPGVLEPHAVAYDDGTGNLLVPTYSTVDTEEGRAVTMEIPTANFQMEYYDSLTRDEGQRRYTFTWPGDYAVGEFSVLLLAPPGATDVQTDPDLTPVQRGSDAFSYVGSLGELRDGQEVQVTFSYQTAAEGTNVLTGPTQVQDDSTNTLLLVGAALGVLLLVIGAALWYTRRSSSRSARKPVGGERPQRATRRASGAQRSSGSAPVAFCTQCGEPLQAGDRFCGHCGEPVKRSGGTG